MSESSIILLTRIAVALERLVDISEMVAGNTEEPGTGVFVLLDPDNVKEVLGGINR